MNMSKYLELLRFYLTEKIGEIDNSLKRTITDEVRNIISSLLSALLSLFISTESIKFGGIGGVILKITVVILLYFFLYFIISKLFRKIRNANHIKKSDKKELSPYETKNYVDKFDHITCDGILLARDFLSRYDENNLGSNEKEFCLIEAFYYYKKAINITDLIITHASSCVNNANNNNGIAPYRLINVYKSLYEIHIKIKNLLDISKIEKKEDFQSDLSQIQKNELDRIIKYCRKWCSNNTCTK